MILGYLLLGWVGGAIAAVAHLATGGSIVGALGLFVGVGNLAVIGLAALCYLRSLRLEARAESEALSSPVPAFPPRGHAEGTPHVG